MLLWRGEYKVGTVRPGLGRSRQDKFFIEKLQSGENIEKFMGCIPENCQTAIQVINHNFKTLRILKIIYLLRRLPEKVPFWASFQENKLNTAWFN